MDGGGIGEGRIDGRGANRKGWDEWIDGWRNVRTGRERARCTDGWTDAGRTDGQTDGWRHGRTNEWTEEPTGGRTLGWMDGQMDEQPNIQEE